MRSAGRRGENPTDEKGLRARWRRRGLRAKAVISFSLFLLVFTLAVSFAVSWTVRENLKLSQAQAREAITKLFQANFRQWAFQVDRISKNFANAPEIRKSIDLITRNGPLYVYSEELIGKEVLPYNQIQLAQEQILLNSFLLGVLKANRLDFAAFCLASPHRLVGGLSLIPFVEVRGGESTIYQYTVKGRPGVVRVYRHSFEPEKLSGFDSEYFKQFYYDSGDNREKVKNAYEEIGFKQTSLPDATCQTYTSDALPGSIQLIARDNYLRLRIARKIRLEIFNPKDQQVALAIAGALIVEKDITEDLLNKQKERIGKDIAVLRKSEVLMSSIPGLSGGLPDSGYVSVGGRDYHYTSSIFPLAGNKKYGLAILSDLDEFNRLSFRLYQAIVLSSLSVFALGVLLLLFLIGRFVRPIRALRNNALELANGNLRQDIDTERRDELGSLARSFARMRDAIGTKILDLEVLYRKIETQNDELKRLDSAKDQFLANTSHELRAPLNGIIGIAESLIDGATGRLPDATLENLFLIASSGQRLFHLVSDLLDFSRLRHKDIELEIRPVGVYEVGSLILSLSQPLIREKEISLINEIPMKIPAVLADENRFQQILHNLVGNAIKFTEAGQVTLSAKEDGDMVQVTVADTGVGIPPERLDAVFDSFEQADDSTTREFEGVGLGLTVTKQLILLHGGKIWVESEVGQGASFHFALPATKKRVEKIVPVARSLNMGRPWGTKFASTGKTPAVANGFDENPNENAAGTTEVATLGAGSFTILVVDDELINRQMVNNHLSLRDYSVHTVSSGMEALRWIKNRGKPDLVLLDVMMPRLNGFEVCQKIRETYSPTELPIILLTARVQVSDLVEGFQAGANDYLTKPFFKAELLARTNNQLLLLLARRRSSSLRDFSRKTEDLKTAKELGRAVFQELTANIPVSGAAFFYGEGEKGMELQVAFNNLAFLETAPTPELLNEIFPDEASELVRFPSINSGSPIYEFYNNSSESLEKSHFLFARSNRVAIPHAIVLYRVPTEPPFSRSDTEYALSIGKEVIVKTRNIATLEEKTRIESELANAATIQKSLLPEKPPELPGFEISVDFESARPLSGDYYDFIPAGAESTAVVLADVSGKGLPASIYADLARVLLRDKGAILLDPREAMKSLNFSLRAVLQPGRYLTMRYILLNHYEGRADYCVLGHEPLALVKAGATEPALLNPAGYPFSRIHAPDFDEKITMGSYQMESGDLLFCCSDGLGDAENEAGEPFGVERIYKLAAEHHSKSASEITRIIAAELAEHRGAAVPKDDWTMVSLKRL